MSDAPNGAAPAAGAALNRLLRELREIGAEELRLETHLTALARRRHGIETALADLLRGHLGDDLAAELGGLLGGAPAGGTRGLVPELGTPALEIRGLNYFPLQNPWWRMFCAWDDASKQQMGRELDIAATLGINTIRTFLPFSLILQDRAYVRTLWTERDHVPNPLPDAPTVLARLDEFLNMTSNRQMQVILGLFDESERLVDIVKDPAGALHYVETVLNFKTQAGLRLGDDRRIAMWDLVNELDDTHKTDPPPLPGGEPPPGAKPLFIGPWPGLKPNPTGIAWLRQIFTQVLALAAPHQEVTIGVLNPFSSVFLLKNGFGDPRHVPQYHEYTRDTDFSSADQFVKAISNDIRIVAAQTQSNRRVLIGETGAPSAGGAHGSPDHQAGVLRTVLDQAIANRARLRGVLIWTLGDWNFAGMGPDNEQQHFGLYSADLQAKPAAAVVRQAFATNV
jgi:hypothetical protein